MLPFLKYKHKLYPVIPQIYIGFVNYFLINHCTKNLFSLESPLTIFFLFFYEYIYSLIVISHLRAQLTNPGYVPALETPGKEFGIKIQFCAFCTQKWKPPRSHHCHQCKQCVMLQEYHEPFLNNCIGIRNMKYFLLFTFYGFLFSFINFLLGVACCAHYFVSSRLTYTQIFYPNFKKIFMVLLCFISIGTMIFFADTFFNVMNNIENNQTVSEQKRALKGKKTRFIDNLKRYLGKNFLFWLVPIKPKVEANYLDPVTEFTYFDEFSAEKKESDEIKQRRMLYDIDCKKKWN